MIKNKTDKMKRIAMLKKEMLKKQSDKATASLMDH